MKIGRNAPCPCGSGKKYKKCCLNKTVTPADELIYRRLNQAHDKLVDRLVRHGKEVFGEMAVAVALGEYCGWPETEEDEYAETVMDHQEQLFWPWFLFDWEYDPDPDDPEGELPGPPERTIAELYAEKKGKRIDALERKIIDAAYRRPFSFLEVVRTDPGKGFVLHDLFRGTRHSVMERTGSQQVEAGDILFGRVVQIDTVSMMLGTSAIAIPASFKAEIMDLANRVGQAPGKATDEDLRDWDMDLRMFYLSIHEALVAPPDLHNTDGDPLVFQSLHFEIDSIETAFEKLCDLCVTVDPAELLEDADLDASGGIERVEIPWNRMENEASAGMPNTLLGMIVIDGEKLTAEVNSARRAETIRNIIEKRLGKSVRYKTTVIQDPDAWEPDDDDTGAAPLADQEALLADPEVRKQMTQFFQKHWEGWVSQKLPALNGKTPQAAVKTAEGREAVAALLADAERLAAKDPVMGDVALKEIGRARKTLGLE
jgi:SEC-C motif